MMLKTRANSLAAFALFGTASLACGTTLAIAAEPPPRLEKVRISDDGRRFVLAESGRVFTPWGFNYLGEFGKLVEDSWHSDWPRIERDVREMRKLGANTVRVHLQFGTFMKGPDTFDPAQLDRLKKLLDLARETGLYLDITGLCCYRLDDIPAWYDELDEAKRWDVQAQWWRTIAKACAGHPAVFCYDLMNEPIIGGPAKEGEPRWVGGELGGFYFVQRISEDAQGRTNLEIAAAWSKQLTEAIRSEDPHTPITVGVIPWAQIWPGAKPVFYSPEAAKHFDFVSIHVYPERDKVAQAVAALAVYDIGKPLVVEETFPLACSIDEMDAFVDGGKDRVDGWISHYFGHTIEEHERGAEPKGTAPDAPFRVTVADFLRFWRDKGKTIAKPPPPKPAAENDPPPGAAADTMPQDLGSPAVRGSVEQIHIVHARPHSRISVRGPRGFEATAIADDRGGLVLRDVPPGDGYRVRIEGVNGDFRAVRVLSRTEHPDASFYTSQKLDPTRGYLATRDGTLLSYRVVLAPVRSCCPS